MATIPISLEIKILIFFDFLDLELIRLADTLGLQMAYKSIWSDKDIRDVKAANQS